MIDTVRSEALKLRTVTMNWILGILAFIFPLAVTMLNALFRGGKADFDTRQLLDVITGSSFVTVLLGGVMAAAFITGEFGFGTIRPTFAATPRRIRVLVAKTVVVVGCAVVLEGLVVLIGVIGGSAIARSKGTPINLSDTPSAVPALVGAVVFAALLALGGLGLGMIIRSTPGAIVTLIVWPLVAEAIVGGLLSLAFKSVRVVEWMPFRAGFRLLNPDNAGPGPSRVVAGFYFGGVMLALAALGAWLVDRRDA
jgi:ABC-2 type transport system permease protein